MISLNELAQIAKITETGAIPLDLPDEQRQALIWRGILLSLRLDGSADAVSLLDKLLANPRSPEISTISFRFLRDLALENNRAAVEVLFAQAVKNQNREAIEFLQSNDQLLVDHPQILLFVYLYEKQPKYLSLDPDQTGLSELFFLQPAAIQDQMIHLAPEKGLGNWALIVQALRNPGSLQSLIESFPQFQQPEQKLCLQLLSDHAQDDPPVRNILCQLFILHDYLPARDLAIEKGYHPDDPMQAALFYFLSEEWTRYEQVDFSQRLLTTAYELSDQPVRRRILALSRSAGQVDWMKNLTSQSQVRWLKELSDIEWDSAIQTLVSGSRFQELWLLAQAAPPLWSGRILLALNQSQWQPEMDEEKAGYSRMVDLALACRENPLKPSPISTWNSPAREIISLAVDRSGNFLAAGNSQTAILRWDLHQDQFPMQTLFSQSPGTNAMSFSPDGNYLVISSGDHKIRLLELAKGMIIKTLEGHKGLVRSLVFHPDGRFLFTASFDGTVQTWRFPSGIRIDSTQVSKQELFGLAASADGKYLVCAGAERLIQVYSLPQMDLARSLAGHSDTITLLAASPAGPYTISYSRDRSLKSWNIASGKELGSVLLDEPLTALAFHPSGQFVIGGGIQGNILIWAFPAAGPLLTLKNHAKTVIGLAARSSCNQLISASTDGKICQWDLSQFIYSRTPLELLLRQQDELSKWLKNSDTPANERAWLEFINSLITWRKRFDIEVADVHPVLHLGKYDIEL